MAGFVMAAVALQAALNLLQRQVEIPLAAGQARQLEPGSLLPGGIPGCLGEGVGCLVEAPLVFQRQSQVVICLAVVGIGVAQGQALERFAEVSLCFGEFAAPAEQQSHGVVAAASPGSRRSASR